MAVPRMGQAHRRRRRHPAHKGWVDLHEGAHFRKWVGDLISLVNEYCSIDGPEAEVFRTIVHLERRFFDDSYPQE